MDIYNVGGAIRDSLLNLPIHDRDYVVVGAEPNDMLLRGMTMVGKDFPVFLDPVRNEEYALARIERKIAPGYAGFAFDASKTVTLEQDLSRRDLTINAMARKVNADGSLGPLIDPFGGEKDLQAKVFRHVGVAFKEDPVRILRVARFAARYEGFEVAPETMQLMAEMVANGEVDALVPERVWQEVSRGLMEKKPSRMINVLHQCGALERIAPDASTNADLLKVLDEAARRECSLPIRYAWWNPNIVRAIPVECQQLVALYDTVWPTLMKVMSLDSEDLLQLMERINALRRPKQFEDMQTLFNLMREEETTPEMDLLSDVVEAMSSINNTEVIGNLTNGLEIKDAIRRARGEAIAIRLDMSR